MRGCLSSVSYAILVNGNAKGCVKATRGLRQGDPLSHFLFTFKHKGLKRKMCWHPLDKKRKNNDRNARFCEFDSRKNTIVNEDLEIRDDVMSLGGTAEN